MAHAPSYAVQGTTYTTSVEPVPTKKGCVAWQTRSTVQVGWCIRKVGRHGFRVLRRSTDKLRDMGWIEYHHEQAQMVLRCGYFCLLVGSVARLWVGCEPNTGTCSLMLKQTRRFAYPPGGGAGDAEARLYHPILMCAVLFFSRWLSIENYWKQQRMFRPPRAGGSDFDEIVRLAWVGSLMLREDSGVHGKPRDAQSDMRGTVLRTRGTYTRRSYMYEYTPYTR